MTVTHPHTRAARARRKHPGSVQYQNSPIGSAQRDSNFAVYDAPHQEIDPGAPAGLLQSSRGQRALKSSTLDTLGLIDLATRRRRSTYREFSVNDQEFHFELIRPDMKTDASLDGFLTEVSWKEQGFVLLDAVGMTGTISIQQQDPGNRGPQGQILMNPDTHRPEHTNRVEIHDGHRLQCWVKWPGGGGTNPDFILLWEMYLDKADGVDIGSGVVQYELVDEATIIQRSEDTFHFPVTRSSHRRGWRAHDIVIDIARRYGIKLGKIAQGRHFVITRSTVFKQAAPMNPMAWAYAQETLRTGEAFVFRFIEGKLNIYRTRRNPLLFQFHDLITSSSIGWNHGAIVTSASVQATLPHKKGSKTGTIDVSYSDHKLIRKYGLIHAELSDASYGKTAITQATSRQDAINQIKRYIANSVKHAPMAEFTTFGIALINAGDAIELDVPEEGFQGLGSGGTAVYFVGSVTHTVSGNSQGYTMDITTTYLDPIDPKTLKSNADKSARELKSAYRGAPYPAAAAHR